MQCDVNLYTDHVLSSDHLSVLVYPNYIIGQNTDQEITLNYKINWSLFKDLAKEL